MDRPIAAFKDRLLEAMRIREIKAVDLSQKTGIPKSSISQYLSGHVEAKTDRNYLLAKALNVDPVWLSGYDVPMEEFKAEPFSEEIANRIKSLRLMKNITLEEFSNALGISETTIKKWENGGNSTMKRSELSKIAKFLGTTPAYLMGWEDKTDNSLDNLPDNIIPMPKMKKIPLVGEIACGVPILADENIEEYLACPDGIHADFCLKCKGDSMIGSRIYNGDIVYIRKQEIVDNGEIAAVLIDGEATLKKVYITPSKVTLRVSNPLYDDIVLDSTNDVHILGLAVAFFSSLQKPQAVSASTSESEIEVFAARDGDTSELNEEGKKAAKELFDNWDNLK